MNIYNTLYHKIVESRKNLKEYKRKMSESRRGKKRGPYKKKLQ